MNDMIKRKQSFLLRLPLSVREQAMKLALEEGTSLNFFISMAVSEKITQLEIRREASQRLAAVRPQPRQSYPSSMPLGPARRMAEPPKPMYG
ncbi:hypothetical protein SAMN05421771_3020 [Granulicella pectinivorans]|uniref:HicB family protein n=1 Tax=Granulicella pectinivorans TaxID=474950 RepID=A0A1I6MMZ9_9BACT|nr:hypothetical protein [Granulicella pectinivorans]SFS16987.1 hypothetical protein SAMN05421771_3020 [Granulicella pectinivorans]